jgi:hypothetical protein
MGVTRVTTRRRNAQPRHRVAHARPIFRIVGRRPVDWRRTRPPRGSPPHDKPGPPSPPIGRSLSSYPHTKRNRRPARGQAACELPNAFPSIGTRATYRQLRPARYPQTRAVADKKCRPARRTWATQVFQSPHSSSTMERRNVAVVVHQGRRTYCECTPDAASDNPAETCANHSLITSYSPPWRSWLTGREGRDPGRCGWGASPGRGPSSQSGSNLNSALRSACGSNVCRRHFSPTPSGRDIS